MAAGAECIWTLLRQPESKPLKQTETKGNLIVRVGGPGGGGGGRGTEQEGGEMMSE